ncbi:MAG: hypothetical protein KDJ65_21770, partial [Anaerolineae bacterium]|nr:hypothetical protein [Anaerolineae bacterium]
AATYSFVNVQYLLRLILFNMCCDSPVTHYQKLKTNLSIIRNTIFLRFVTHMGYIQFTRSGIAWSIIK